MSRTRLELRILAALVSISGCVLPQDITPAPVGVESISVGPNPNMVTAAALYLKCSGPVVRVRVRYNAAATDSGMYSLNLNDSCPPRIDIVGLLPATTYTIQTTVWAKGGDSATYSGPTLQTDSLPVHLPRIDVHYDGVAPAGFTMFNFIDPTDATRGIALAIDGQGRVRWYLRADRLIGDLQPQGHGRYTASVTLYEPLSFVSLGYAAAEYHELDNGGNYVRKWTATGGYPTDGHDVRFTSHGTVVLLGFDFRTMDLTSYGGLPNAQVLGNVLEEVDSTGAPVFVWNAFDHFTITDIDPAIPLTGSRIDWNHGNAIEIDTDGNYLISFRHLSEITKIDSRTGAVIWRFGGRRNEFQFQGDTTDFSFQHGVRRLANGNLILFDNGNTHSPTFSRAMEYRLDEQNKTATAVWQYRPSPDLPTSALGFAQRLRNGNTLVTFGTQNIVQEVSPQSRVVWQLTGPRGLWIYRAYRIQSLYDGNVE